MAIEILDHGACKAAGTYSIDDGGDPLLAAQGIVSAVSMSVDNYLANLTLQEEIAFDELIGFVANSTAEIGSPNLHWVDKQTVQVDIAPLDEEPSLPAVDFILFKIQGMKPVAYAPIAIPEPPGP